MQTRYVAAFREGLCKNGTIGREWSWGCLF